MNFVFSLHFDFVSCVLLLPVDVCLLTNLLVSFPPCLNPSRLFPPFRCCFLRFAAPHGSFSASQARKRGTDMAPSRESIGRCKSGGSLRCWWHDGEGLAHPHVHAQTHCSRTRQVWCAWVSAFCTKSARRPTNTDCRVVSITSHFYPPHHTVHTQTNATRTESAIVYKLSCDS